jgi:acetyl esterase/lipase
MVVSPARILSIIDPLLPIEALRAIFHAYIPEESVNTLENPYLSPGAVSDEILQQFPSKTFIAVGALDPLLDDSIYFAKRLWQVGRPVRLKVFDGFPHGFLNLASVPSKFRFLQF